MLKLIRAKNSFQLPTFVAATLILAQVASAITPIATIGDGTSGAGNNQFNIPRGITLDASDNILVADAGNDRIQIFSPLLPGPIAFFQSIPIAAGGASIQGITTDSSGNIYAVDSNNTQFYIYNNIGALQSTTPSNSGIPLDVAVGPDGSIYVSTLINGTDKYSAAAAFLSNLASVNTNAVTVDSNNNVYAVKPTSVQVYDSSGTLVSTITNANFQILHGAAVDSSNNLYLSDLGNGTVFKYSAAGTLLGSASIGGILTDMAIDSNGNIYVISSTANQVRIFSSSIFGGSAADQASASQSLKAEPSTSTNEIITVTMDQIVFVNVVEVQATKIPLSAQCKFHNSPNIVTPISTATSVTERYFNRGQNNKFEVEKGNAYTDPLMKVANLHLKLKNLKNSFWAQGIGQTTNKKSSSGFNSITGGFAFGGDRKINHNHSFGAFGGYTVNNYKQKSSLGDGSLNTLGLGVYHSYVTNSGLFLVSTAGLGLNKFEKDRYTAAGIASSDHRGYGLTLDMTLGKPLYLGNGVTFTPTATAGIGYSKQKSYQETGAPGLNLSVNSASSTFGKLGISSEIGKLYLTKKALYKPSINIGYLYRDNLSGGRSIDATFVGQSQGFTAALGNSAQNIITSGAGIDIMYPDASVASLKYTNELSSNQQMHGVMFKWKVKI